MFQPDHKTLGFRLKGAFKDVMKEIKALDDAKITSFLKTHKMEILGHEIGPDDLRIMYTFAGEGALTEKYEAHSDNDLLILLDCTPDQSMLDEGVSREVINRVQKLRKKANLMPSDDVTVYFELSPPKHDLARIISEFRETIEVTTKSPIRDASQKANGMAQIAQDSYDLKGAKLKLTIVKGFCANFSRSPGEGSSTGNLKAFGKPNCAFVNVVDGNRAGVVLLENPVGENVLTPPQLKDEIKSLFYVSGDIKLSQDVSSLNGKTITVSGSPTSDLAGSSCPFVNVEMSNKKRACLLLENPSGTSCVQELKQVLAMFDSKSSGKLYGDKNKKSEIPWNKVKDYVGKTVFA
jgi:isoleucyl-tRNA synthetase